VSIAQCYNRVRYNTMNESGLKALGKRFRFAASAAKLPTDSYDNLYALQYDESRTATW
jgi:hypothetical protein